MKNYSTLIKDKINSVYQTNVANKILQFMDKIRNESDDNQARRFVMELLQNARDLAYKENGERLPVSVRVKLTDNELEFSHSGRVFSVKDILSIINQVSSKKPGEGIGQFGTGFMSTYQLSETVELKSYIKDEDNPYKLFDITIDRTGRDKQAILDGISKSLDMLYEVDSSGDILEAEFDKNAYNTVFSYHLDNERSRRIAQIGVEDMENTLPYILLFSESIGKVELIFDTIKDKKNMVYTSIEDRQLANGLCQKLIKKENNGNIETLSLLYEQTSFGDDNKAITVACCNKDRRILPIPDKTTRLYIDFPLIGSENFPFPMVVNSEGFRPNEPRSGISLVDNENSEDAKKNKEIMRKAVEMYGHFLGNLVDNSFEGLENIMHMPIYEESREWSQIWVQSNIYQGVWQGISDKNIFVSTDGKYKFIDDNFKLIRAQSEQERKRVQELMSCMKNIRISMDDVPWEQVFEGYNISENKLYDLEKVLTNARQLAVYELDDTKLSIQKWIGDLYTAAMENEKLANEILLGNISIFLDQKYELGNSFELKNFREIRIDPDIPEFLKDTADALDILQVSDEQILNIRSVLLHKDFPIDKNNMPEKYELDRLINYITRKADRGCKVVNYSYYSERYMNAWKKAWKIMIANGPDDDIKKLAEKFWQIELTKDDDTKADDRFSDYIWKSTYTSVLTEMYNSITTRTLNDVCAKLKMNEDEVIDWLNDLYRVGIQYIREDKLKYMSAVLNQEKQFVAAYDLKIDTMDEELKNIAIAFKDKYTNCDIMKNLVDKRINLPGWNLSEYNNELIASAINLAVQQLLASASLSEAKEEYQAACTALLGWIDENMDAAGRLFPAFYNDEDKMKLLTTKAAVNLNRKAKKLDMFLDKIGVSDMDEALKRMEDLEKELEKTKDALNKAEKADDEEDSGESEEENSVGKYDENNDIFFGGDAFLLGLTDVERNDRLREIGVAGEKYGYQKIIDDYALKGFTLVSRDDMKCTMERNVLSEPEKDTDENNGTVISPDSANVKEVVEIYKPDIAGYHQAGWDIRVTLSRVNEGTATVVSTDYYEIKTNTSTSIYRDCVIIKDEQVKKAIIEEEHYHILRLHCNSMTLAIVDEIMYDNPMLLYANGEFLNMDKVLRLYERRRGTRG